MKRNIVFVDEFGQKIDDVKKHGRIISLMRSDMKNPNTPLKIEIKIATKIVDSLSSYTSEEYISEELCFMKRDGIDADIDKMIWLPEKILQSFKKNRKKDPQLSFAIHRLSKSSVEKFVNVEQFEKDTYYELIFNVYKGANRGDKIVYQVTKEFFIWYIASIFYADPKLFLSDNNDMLLNYNTFKKGGEDVKVFFPDW